MPQTSWSAGDSNWKLNPKTFFVLVLGLWLFGSGEAALVAAGLGQSPWTVLAVGVSKQAAISIGWAYFWISACVLLLWIPLRQKPGIGTFVNIVVIATSLQVMISVFPNPTTDKVMIQGFSQPLTAANYNVFSVDGKQVQVDVLDNKTLDTAHLECGIYFLRIDAQEGTETIRFVKE